MVYCPDLKPFCCCCCYVNVEMNDWGGTVFYKTVTNTCYDLFCLLIIRMFRSLVLIGSLSNTYTKFFLHFPLPDTYTKIFLLFPLPEPVWTGQGLNRSKPVGSWTSLNQSGHELVIAWTSQDLNRSGPEPVCTSQDLNRSDRSGPIPVWTSQGLNRLGPESEPVVLLFLLHRFLFSQSFLIFFARPLSSIQGHKKA